ncbi:uncharacterized protein A4U43_C05F23200 [Asparagus officinalis]|uniref:Uncharacterized protein n=1 Tax=Asparagus officinalis TaxID=4686 RepID=A0A5P1EU03_ASPOF|nr:uncharacterized protein A4U43_C05F23200 [Asparagus officinalis]
MRSRARDPLLLLPPFLPKSQLQLRVESADFPHFSSSVKFPNSAHHESSIAADKNRSSFELERSLEILISPPPSSHLLPPTQVFQRPLPQLRLQVTTDELVVEVSKFVESTNSGPKVVLNLAFDLCAF